MAEADWIPHSRKVANPTADSGADGAWCGSVRAGGGVTRCHIIELSIKNRFMVLLLTAVLVGGSRLWSIFHIRLDAIPDLSDVQVIVTTEYPGQNPEVVDQQVTYPLASAMLSVPGSTAVRGFSMFEQSFVYVLFEDGTDIYWARSRVLEYLNFARDAAAQGRRAQARPGRHRRGLGLPVRALSRAGTRPDHPNGLWHDKEQEPLVRDARRRARGAARSLERVRAFESPARARSPASDARPGQSGPRAAPQPAGLVPALSR